MALSNLLGGIVTGMVALLSWFSSSKRKKKSLRLAACIARGEVVQSQCLRATSPVEILSSIGDGREWLESAKQLTKTYFPEVTSELDQALELAAESGNEFEKVKNQIESALGLLRNLGKAQ